MTADTVLSIALGGALLWVLLLVRRQRRMTAALWACRHYAAMVADDDPNPNMRIVAGRAVDQADAILQPEVSR